MTTIMYAIVASLANLLILATKRVGFCYQCHILTVKGATVVENIGSWVDAVKST